MEYRNDKKKEERERRKGGRREKKREREAARPVFSKVGAYCRLSVLEVSDPDVDQNYPECFSWRLFSRT